MGAPVFIWLILLPLMASPLIYLGGRLQDRVPRWPIAQLLALLALLVTWMPFAQSVREVNAIDRMGYSLGSVNLCFDGISLLLSAVALGLGTMVVLFSGPYLATQVGQEKYYAMLVAMIGVMVGLGCACDLFNLWVWFEAMAISSYLLVAFYRDQPKSLEAGVKYLVQSATGSVLVILGISLVLADAGTLDISAIRELNHASPLLLVAGGLFVIGFGVKAALVPLHTWLPDAHSQAPSGISAMLSGVVIEAGLIAMLRSLSALAGVTLLWGPLLMGFGAINMLVGNLLALRQVHIKRLLAYSSLTHVGYMLVGLGVAIYAGHLNGAQGGFFHLFNHGMMKGLAFLAAGALLYALHLASGEHLPLTVSDLAGAARRYPLVALTFSLAVFALGGIPPLSGFMSKWQIIVSGFESQNLLVIALVVFAALNSVLSLAYYAPLVNVLYRWEPSVIISRGRQLPRLFNLPLIALAILILLAGIWPALTYPLTLPAGTALLAAFGR